MTITLFLQKKTLIKLKDGVIEKKQKKNKENLHTVRGNLQ